MTAAQTQRYEFRAEVQQLLHILAHALYTDRDIFLRELVSNASDALNRLQFEQLTNADLLDPEMPLEIRIRADKETRTLTIQDTGIGMNREEMIENLGTIAHSGALSFLKAMRERGNANNEIIGQFGVGFYSVFMVADNVVVTSRSFRKGDTAATWTSDGSGSYTLEDAEKAERGTTITLHLKEDAEEFLTDYRLSGIIKKHSNYIAFPIYVGETVANSQTALWRRPAREVSADDYTEFYKQITYDFGAPLLHLHLAADAPVQFYSLLYVPSKLDRGLLTQDASGGPRLYARKVLIQEHAKELLPEWMRFIEGVVDSEDLPLNISRETVQSNRMMQRLKTTISGKIIGELESIAEKDPERYTTFWQEFGRMIKEGVVTDAAHRERLGKLLRFRSLKHPEGWLSLQGYVDAMPADQTDIYYLFGDDPKIIQRSPHLDVFRARNIDVLLLTEQLDGFLVNALATFDEKKLHNGADAEINLPNANEGEDAPTGEALPEDRLVSLVERIGEVLGERVQGVRESKVLTESPARLVAPDQGFGADMERVYKMLNEQFEVPKRILEINPRHALIRALDTVDDPTLAGQLIEQIFESALLIEGLHPNPMEMVERIQAIMVAAASRK
ncbi:MAG TPA: molecular chaperone HtpG [Aggregatilineales bacterium]|nr:molecular chaperone HtpG [Anaerolineales bacterium]HRE48709.1 molecular chaperone HtpG [Aggregatilineales bacterium]